WDLNGDGTFGDSTVQKPLFTYTSAGTYTAVLRVTDNHAASTLSTPITITVNPATATTFGTTTPGTLVDTAAANVKEVSKFTAPQAGNVVKVTGYVSGLGAATGTQKVKAIMYADSAGKPGARLGVSKEVTINAGQAWGWVAFEFASPVAIQAGTVWIGYIAAQKGDLTQMRYSVVANDLRFNNNTYSSGPTATFGNGTIGALHYSIYGTYG